MGDGRMDATWMTTTSLQGVSWRDIPHHPVKRAGAILGVSRSQVYKFAREGRLHVVKSADKPTSPRMAGSSSKRRRGTER